MFKTKDAKLNFVYSIGAAIVILGALFKLNHWHIGPFTGTAVLAIGLITEAIIFLIFAFDLSKLFFLYHFHIQKDYKYIHLPLQNLKL